MKTIEATAPPTPALGEVLVRVEGVSKKFCRDLKRSLWYGVKDMAHELNPFGGGATGADEGHLRPGEFWANRGVSFEVRRGECLGLLGRNGAGKTTLLRMLNGLIKPDTGRIEMRGNIAALIALGAGFNPILTGRENIYINAAVLGLSKKEVDRKFDDIVDFAEVRDFIDAPVQSYSSGMQVRLGFSIATALEPDVLILDEVLAVGDFAFRQKCLRRVEQLLGRCAVLFVSHNIDQVERVCTRAVVLEKGQPVFDGPTTPAIEIYNRLHQTNSMESAWLHEDLAITGPEPGARLVPQPEGGHRVELHLEAKQAFTEIACRLRFRNPEGDYVAEYHTLNHRPPFPIPTGASTLRVDLPALPLKSGTYRVDLFLSQANNDLVKIAEVRGFAQVEGAARSHGFNCVQI